MMSFSVKMFNSEMLITHWWSPPGVFFQFKWYQVICMNGPEGFLPKKLNFTMQVVQVLWYRPALWPFGDL